MKKLKSTSVPSQETQVKVIAEVVRIYGLGSDGAQQSKVSLP
jgi:hypothetical protein